MLIPINDGSISILSAILVSMSPPVRQLWWYQRDNHQP